MGFRFIPREMQFFDLFDDQAKKIIVTAQKFRELTASGKFGDEEIQRMRDLEHEGDAITHDIIDKLNRTFITPFDREDIHGLAQELDNVIDMLYTTSKRMRIYKLHTPNNDLIQFADLIVQSATAVGMAINGLRTHKNYQPIRDSCIEVNHIENLGDQLRDSVIERLFDEVKDPVEIIKWKEIFEEVETILDICEDIANLIDSIMVKQG
jgi:hypothetical protein